MRSKPLHDTRSIALYPGLPVFFNVCMRKITGRPGYEAMLGAGEKIGVHTYMTVYTLRRVIIIIIIN